MGRVSTKAAKPEWWLTPTPCSGGRGQRGNGSQGLRRSWLNSGYASGARCTQESRTHTRSPVKDSEQWLQPRWACESMKPDPQSRCAPTALSVLGRGHSAAALLVGTGPRPCRVCANSENQQESGGLKPQTEGKAGTWPFFLPHPAEVRGHRPPLSRETEGATTPLGFGKMGLRSRPRPPTHHFGLEGRLDLPVLEFLPVDPPEEGVLPHVPFPLGPATQPLAGVFGHQLESSRKEDATYTVVTTGDDSISYN